MISRLSCPNGHILGITPEMEGKTVQCPKCQAIMQVPIMTAVEPMAPRRPPPVPTDVVERSPSRRDLPPDDDDDRPRRGSRRDDDDYDDEPRGRRSRRDDDYEEDDERDAKAKKRLRRQQLVASRMGLLLYYWKFILYLGAMFAYIINVILSLVFSAMAVTAAQRGDRGGLESAAVVVWMVTLLGGFAMLATFVVAPILGIIGGSFIVRVPTKSGARGLAIATLVLEAVPVGCGILAVVTGAFSRGNPSSAGMSLIFILLAGLAMLAGFILFMLFLAKIAVYLRDKRTAQEANSLMIAYLITSLVGPFVIGIAAVFLARIPCAGPIILLVMVIGWMVLMIKTLLGILAVIATVCARI